MQQNTLCVAYGADDNYAKLLGTSMLSLLEHNTDFERIVIYVLDCGIRPENRRNLAGIAEEWRREIHFIPMQEAIEGLHLNLGAHKIAVASYARLFLASLLPEAFDRVLYVDCDTLVLDSLRPFWETDFNGALIAGAQDVVDSYFLNIIRLPKTNKYINAGVLLINLAAWRAEKMQDRFLEIIESFGGNVPHHDQGTINAACGSQRVIVPVRYNFTTSLFSFSARTIRRIYFLDDYYTQEEMDAARANPAIVHFTTGLLGRPWEQGSTHPYRQAFRDTIARTPWAGTPEAPDSRYPALKAFTLFYKVVPKPLFEVVYRAFSWVLHLRR